MSDYDFDYEYSREMEIAKLGGLALLLIGGAIAAHSNKKKLATNDTRTNTNTAKDAVKKPDRSEPILDFNSLTDVDLDSLPDVGLDTFQEFNAVVSHNKPVDYCCILDQFHFIVSKEISEFIVKLKLDPDKFKVHVPMKLEQRSYRIDINNLPRNTAREFFCSFNKLFDCFKANKAAFIKTSCYNDFHKWASNQRYMFRDQMILADFLLSEIKEIKQTNCLEVDFIAAHQRCQIMLQHYSNMT